MRSPLRPHHGGWSHPCPTTTPLVNPGWGTPASLAPPRQVAAPAAHRCPRRQLRGFGLLPGHPAAFSLCQFCSVMGCRRILPRLQPGPVCLGRTSVCSPAGALGTRPRSRHRSSPQMAKAGGSGQPRRAAPLLRDPPVAAARGGPSLVAPSWVAPVRLSVPAANGATAVPEGRSRGLARGGFRLGRPAGASAS